MRDKAKYEYWLSVNRAQHKHFVHFLHISKTGGTAIRHALKGNRVTDKYAILLQNHPTRLHNIPVGQSVIFFLRDPADRFVSAFNFRLRCSRPTYDEPWTPEEQKVFAVYLTPAQLARELSAEDPTKRRRAEYAMNNIRHLNEPYTNWLSTPSYVHERRRDILSIGFQESLEADFEAIKSKLGLPATLMLPRDPIVANRAPMSIDKNLDEIALTNLKEWYADDYELVACCRTLRERILNS